MKQRDLDAMLDELVKDRTPEEILGESGLVKELTKRLVERALEGEMTVHLGYEKRLGRPVLDALEVYSSEPANEPVPGPSLVVTPTGLKRCAAGPHMARAASGAARALPGLNATA